MSGTGRRKGRAIVPMHRIVRAALGAARRAAVSEHLIECGGRPVASIKRAFGATVAPAGLRDMTLRVMRRTSALDIAAAAVSMSKIAQFLGHSGKATTERVNARFAPSDLLGAADALDFGGPSQVQQARNNCARYA